MDCYIYLVQEQSGTNLLVSCASLAREGDLVSYADGNIGRVERADFYTASQYELLKDAVDIYPAEMVYMPSPAFEALKVHADDKT